MCTSSEWQRSTRPRGEVLFCRLLSPPPPAPHHQKTAVVSMLKFLLHKLAVVSIFKVCCTYMRKRTRCLLERSSRGIPPNPPRIQKKKTPTYYYLRRNPADNPNEEEETRHQPLCKEGLSLLLCRTEADCCCSSSSNGVCFPIRPTDD
ncbi:unnamed protein product [Ectocarpus sp. 4 AP-2014]